jgi:transmembrane sensor
MNYKEYDIVSFLKDEEFKKWVLTPDDSNTKFWQEFLKAHPEQRTNFQIAQQIIISLEFDEYVEKDEDKQDILQNIYLGATSDRGLKFAKRKLHRNNRISDIYKIAASLVLVASLSLLWISNFQKPPVEETVASTVLKENPRGRKSIVQLPDGSMVRLNSESRITYPEHFAHHERVVHLVGEAFFEVTEDKESPFSVVTGNINTTVLGTSFNIQAWQDDSTINISLAEGKVSVSQIGSSNGQAYYLNPGDKIELQSFYHDEI